MISDFWSQSLTDMKPGAPVTESNILSFMGVYEVVSHTPHEHHHCDRIFGQRPNCDFSSFLSFFSGQRLPYMIKPSSVTKRNNMEGVVKCMGMVYTPHQCWYSDRKSPYLEKSWKVSEGTSGTWITIPNTSLLMALTIFNPLNRTWAISRPPRGKILVYGI